MYVNIVVDSEMMKTVLFLVLAIELLMACQALDLLLPLTSTPPLQAVHDLVRQTIPYVF